MTLLAFQQQIADLLAAIPALAQAQCRPLAENACDITHQVESALENLGLAGTVATPDLEIADDGIMLVNTLLITFGEFPTINRSRAGYISAMDAAVAAANSLRQGASGVAPRYIRQRDEDGLIRVTLECTTSALLTSPQT